MRSPLDLRLEIDVTPGKAFVEPFQGAHSCVGSHSILLNPLFVAPDIAPLAQLLPEWFSAGATTLVYCGSNSTHVFQAKKCGR